MKSKKKNKLLAILMLILMLFSTVQPVFAASGSGTWSGGQYASGMKTTDNQNGTTGVLIRRLNNVSTGERRTVFCAEHGVDFKTGASYNGVYYTPADSTIRKACKVAYLGWYKDYGTYTVDGGILASDMVYVKWAYVFTQQYIWEILGQSNATFINSNEQAEYINFKTRINNEMAEIERRPSFNGSIINIEAGETKEITDTNGVLSAYSAIDKTQDGIRFIHNAGSNSMTISVDENTNLENYRISDSTFKSWGMIKNGTQDEDTMVYFEFPSEIQNQLYCMNFNDPVTLNFSLKIDLLGNLEMTKLDTEGNLVDGAIFTVTGANNYSKDVTVTNGKITLEKLRKGIYTIKEKSAPYGYLLDTNEYKIEVKPNQTVTQTLTNIEPTGNITIIKKDTKMGSTTQGDATFNGAVYKVYAAEDIYNYAKTKRFYEKGDLVATRTINASGTTEDVTELPLGKYVVKEETAPEGYLLDTNEYEVNLEYKNQTEKIVSNVTTSYDKVKEMGVHIFKSGIKENSGVTPGLEGVEFTIKLNSDVEKAYSQGYTYAEVWSGIDENGDKVEVNQDRVSKAQTIAPTYEIIKTDKEGNAYTQNKLAYGKYIVKETVTPTDYETAVDFTFSITQDETEVKDIAKKTKTIVVNNEQLETYIKLIKKDQKTGKTITLNSTTFEIKAKEDIYDRATQKIIFKKGEIVSQKVGKTTYTSFTTNADNIVVPTNSYNTENDDKGTVTTPLKLPVGSYEITEITVPDGFLQLDEPVTFEIKNIKDYDTDLDGDFVKEVTIKNEKPTGTLKLDKIIAIRENVDTSLIDISDLSTIKFKITAKENIVDKTNGSCIYTKGQEVGIYNLSKDGKLIVSDLPMGIYEVEEIETLEGLVLNNQKYEVKFEQKDLTTKVYDEILNVENKTTLVELSKTNITGDKELEGATLTLSDKEGNIIDTWVSGKETHKIEGLTVGNSYTLKEEIQVEGYVKATDIEFKIENTSEVQKVTMIDKIVEVVKTDFVTGKELEGAELEVVDKETGETVDKWTSTNEPHRVIGLEENKEYILKETTAPYGYEMTEKIEFVVTENKETQKIEMKDMPILQDIKLVKVDSNTKETIKAKFSFGIYEDVECTKLIKEVESDKESGTVLFEDLRYGVYYIKELQAPKGYMLSDKIVKVEINDKGVFIDDTKVEGENSIYTFEFYNTIIDTPKTGDNSNLTLWTSLLALSTIALATVGVHEYKKKKKVNKK